MLRNGSLPCVVLCHHGMTRPRVADGVDGLQIRRVHANILNKQSWTADRGWSSSLGVGLVTKCQTGPRNWMDFPEYGM
jgi:hypothetical protein